MGVARVYMEPFSLQTDVFIVNEQAGYVKR